MTTQTISQGKLLEQSDNLASTRVVRFVVGWSETLGYSAEGCGFKSPFSQSANRKLPYSS